MCCIMQHSFKATVPQDRHMIPLSNLYTRVCFHYWCCLIEGCMKSTQVSTLHDILMKLPFLICILVSVCFCVCVCMCL